MEPKMQKQNAKNEDLEKNFPLLRQNIVYLKWRNVWRKKVLYLIHFRKSNLLYNNGSIIQIYCWFGN